MTVFKSIKAVIAGSIVTLVTVGTVPAFGATLHDYQGPRGADQQVPAKLDDIQAPRGMDQQAAAHLDDIQAPRGTDQQAAAQIEDVQAPRSAE